MEGAQNVASDTNVHACAACKHQHRRCQFEACSLALYFPVNKTEEFQNAHRVYGVSNLIIILHSVPEHLRHKTPKTLILEATMRKEFSVHGSLAVQAQTSVLRLDELIDSYHAFTNFGVLLGQPRSEARGKQPVGCDKGKEMEDEEATADDLLAGDVTTSSRGSSSFVVALSFSNEQPYVPQRCHRVRQSARSKEDDILLHGRGNDEERVSVHGSLAVQVQTSVLISENEKELEFVKKQISFFKKMKRLIPNTYNHLYGRRCPKPPPTVESTSDANLVNETITQEDSFESTGESF
ncbi:hypothetical protein Vadar_008381 [Vaccinium darrowii]|uniref:Uncharacterized protein n=1 Tax=Vaccinium darrowii TaxID=229202 RepID=A0ACB7YCD3_9ERIC|nr:hypothetical protein Vadar_008381 [Vaccinium darrowii]